MRTPLRKAERDRRQLTQEDHHLTQEAKDRLQRTLARLKREHGPAVEEVRRTASMGDFSENAAYAQAKSTLRRINTRILEIEELLKCAILIQPSTTGVVQIGSTVTVVRRDTDPQTFTIVGPREASPDQGRLSYASPLGQVLIGKRAGDHAELVVRGASVLYHVQHVS